MKIPESMKAELATWFNGEGANLEDWVCSMGNFSLAVGYSAIFWPSFVEFEDYIFIGDSIDDDVIKTIRSFEAQEGSSPKSVECTLNHFHIWHLQHVGCEDISKDKIIQLGNTLREIYQVKLNYLFPNKPCIVEFYHPEDPEDLSGYEMTFWQKKYEESA